MSKEWRKTGIGFNIKDIKESRPEVWNKYKNDLIKGYPQIDEMDVVFMNELVPHIDGRLLRQFLKDCLPEKSREEVESWEKLGTSK
ncbi:hypothetical protein [Pseudobacillus badius]|uniref:hypothetical protein n=1 Tax=Bacillus badius TaxID=1455 RepID=UPI0007B07446|nr:hypothetical protein [Bacillus badius]KZO01259.1 hypothetical protein A4244_13425 [Bacillus badius]OCS89437.1 hypothetical protein A6M11_13445 [Bacillus badius]OVE51185.1 hypothetical protein B1A98_12425 [Bacillus badius]TDW02172.1 hypothetical protein B0G66_1071 [Bacillus badius]